MQLIKRQLAPTSLIYEGWLATGQISGTDFVEEASATTICFSFVKIGSPFYRDLIEFCQKKNRQPEFIITPEQLIKAHDHEFDNSVHHTLLLNQTVSPILCKKIANTLNGLKRWNFVLVAAKDWHFVNTYRSLPWYMRENLFVDFPLALFDEDPFFSSTEISLQKQHMQSFFPCHKLRSYCPDHTFLCEGQEGGSESLGLAVNIDNTDTIEEKNNVNYAERTASRYYKYQQLQSLYIGLYKATPRVAIEGHIQFLMRPFALFSRNLWRLKPKTYRMYWRMKHLMMSSAQIYWYCYKLSFPLRKIYYVIDYQIKKRVCNQAPPVNQKRGSL